MNPTIGQRISTRGEDFIITDSKTNNDGTFLIDVEGISELVKGKRFSFDTNLDTDIKAVDPLTTSPTAGAFVAARSLGANWFLPSYSELYEIYRNRTAINATLTTFGGAAEVLTNNYYWSSTPIGPYAGSDGIGKWTYALNITAGQPRIDERRKSFLVRAVRAF
jgi:hypothetical protein